MQHERGDRQPGPAADAADLAERWGVPTGHVYALARQDAIPVVRLGRYRRFRLADVEAFEAAGGTEGSR